MNLTSLRHAATATVLLAAFSLTGCASTSSEQHQYLLRDQTAAPHAHPAPMVSIGRLTLPDYLYDDALVLLLNDQEVHHARQHRWAEPPPTAIERYLAQRINARMAMRAALPPAEVSVDIEELIGNIDGNISLRASYRISDAKGPVRSERYSRQLQQPTDGYSGLVAGHAAILDSLAATIADDLGSPGER